ncbi:MAG TPA: FtsQ-type POTRA domain-containing protein [Nitriliruptorales bacterium]|nr:FtsQ-type POTRA domain-containing protein [Nitriliruptorales bacterium]
MALLLFGSGTWLERSQLVALAEVEVVGARRLDPDVVRDVAGLTLGTSTLRLRLRSARQRVEALPLVGSATVRRVDPLTVRIAVRERRPALLLDGRGADALVDAEGVVLIHGEASPSGAFGGDLPTLVSRAPPPPPGASVTDAPGVAHAFAVYRALPGPLRARVDRYQAVADDGVELVLSDGVPVRFGRADRIDEKARALGALLEELAGTPVAGIDVRAPRNPVVTAAQA